MELDTAKRTHTLLRVDADVSILDDLKWSLNRWYEVMAKEYSGRKVLRLAKAVVEWVQDSVWPERPFVWMIEQAVDYTRPCDILPYGIGDRMALSPRVY